jgi:hypothetical protein
MWGNRLHKKRGGMKEGEVGGMWTSEVTRLGEAAGFRLTLHRRFVYWMNNLYLFEVLA